MKQSLTKKRIKIKQVENQRRVMFGTQSYDHIVGKIDTLHTQYCKGDSTTVDSLSRCNELENAIDNQMKGYSAVNQKHIFLRVIAESSLQGDVKAVRASSVNLAESLDPQIAEKLAILRSAGPFVDSIEGIEVVNCPACGQTIGIDEFREHVNAESERLQEINSVFDTYRAAIGTVCNSLESLKTALDKPGLKCWRHGLGDADIIGGLKHLEQINTNVLRESCSEEDLSAIESKLFPIIAIAERDSKDAPPDVQQLTADNSLLSVAKSVIVSRVLDNEITKIDALVTLINSLEQGVRSEIRKQLSECDRQNFQGH